MNYEISFIKKPQIWRIQGDIQNGDLKTLTLEIFWRVDWIDSQGKTINSEPGGMTRFTPTPELIENFSEISEAIYAQILQPEPNMVTTEINQTQSKTYET